MKKLIRVLCLLLGLATIASLVVYAFMEAPLWAPIVKGSPYDFEARELVLLVLHVLGLFAIPISADDTIWK